jgi:hypothetical protein
VIDDILLIINGIIEIFILGHVVGLMLLIVQNVKHAKIIGVFILIDLRFIVKMKIENVILISMVKI